ncbi:MAG: hypothetical protein SVK08_12230, partial [Halobacteriota archaeon]|nr:hypothetical protein [Halobacteriota archaeon]
TDNGDGTGDFSWTPGFGQSGSYPVTFTASDGSLTDDEEITISVNEPTATPSPSPTPIPLAGGGGGSVGAGLSSSGLKTDKNGLVLVNYTKNSSDGRAKLVIPAGTIALDKDGKPLKSVDIIPTELGGTIAAYTLEPDGATFEPPISFIITYDVEDAPEGTELVIKVYEGEKWVELETTIDTKEHTVTAKISHFSVFALFKDERSVHTLGIPVPISASEPTSTPTPTTAATPTEVPQETVVSWTWIFVVTIFLALIVLTAYIYYNSRD